MAVRHTPGWFSCKPGSMWTVSGSSLNPLGPHPLRPQFPPSGGFGGGPKKRGGGGGGGGGSRPSVAKGAAVPHVSVHVRGIDRGFMQLKRNLDDMFGVGEDHIKALTEFYEAGMTSIKRMTMERATAQALKDDADKQMRGLKDSLKKRRRR